MPLVKKASLILYRFAEKGLEVLMLNDPNDVEKLDLPKGATCDCPDCEDEAVMMLEPIEQKDGNLEQAFAVEGDWHEIPSLKSMLQEDAIFVKDTIKSMVPEMMEKGTFVAIKEALKKVMPEQYNLLKELKDTLLERNTVTNI